MQIQRMVNIIPFTRVCWETEPALATHWFTGTLLSEWNVNQWIHRHSSTEDNSMSFSKPDTILNVAYLNKPSIDPVANRTKAVAVVANKEATKSQLRRFLNFDQTHSTSDDVPQRLTTKEVSEMLPEVRPKRSTLPTAIPFVVRT